MPLLRRPRKVNVEIRNYETELPYIPWIKRYPVVAIVIAAILILSLTIGGITYFYRKSNPVSRFVSALTKDIESSCAFDVTATYNDEQVMHYTGAVASDTRRQSLRIALDAEVTDYSYRNVVYTSGKTSYFGNYYNGQWTVSDCSPRVLDFYDFYADFRYNHFDAGAYLRFFDKTSEYNADELKKAVEKLLKQFASSNDLSNLTISNTEDGTVYTYTPDVYAMAKEIENRGGSVFFSADGYALYSKRVGLNEEALKDAQVRLSYTISSGGYLTDLEFSIESNGEKYELDCTMSDFGVEPEISEDFFSAAGIPVPKD